MAKTWQVILATIAIFVAGLVTGGATTFGVIRWVARQHARANAAQQGGGMGGGMGGWQQRQGQPQPLNPQLLRSFAEKLDLTPEQRMRVMPIVRRTAAQLNRERREVQLTSALLIEKMQDDIADVLTPAQKAKFEELLSQKRAQLEQFRKGLQQQQARPEPTEPNPSTN